MGGGQGWGGSLLQRMKTTEADFEKFKEACLYWQNFFGIYDWRLFFEWRKLNGNNAQFNFDSEARQAHISMNRGDVDCSIEELAKHEVIEGLLLGKLREMAILGKSSEAEVEEECHRIVNILEAKLTRP